MATQQQGHNGPQDGRRRRKATPKPSDTHSAAPGPATAPREGRQPVDPAILADRYDRLLIGPLDGTKKQWMRLQRDLERLVEGVSLGCDFTVDAAVGNDEGAIIVGELHDIIREHVVRRVGELGMAHSFTYRESM